MSLTNYIAAFLAVLSLASGVASAAIVNFQFTGTVLPHSGTFTVPGNQITGGFSYDTETLPSSSWRWDAKYVFPEQFSLSANIDGHSVVTNDLTVLITNDYYNENTMYDEPQIIEDWVSVSSRKISIDGISYPNGSFGISLSSINGSPLTNTALPAFLNPAKFMSSIGWLRSDYTPEGQLLRFSVDSITPIPLPPTLILMMSGMLAIAVALKRNFKNC